MPHRYENLSGKKVSLDISIFGLGYVGSVVSGCLSNDGHTVVGVDVDQVKIDLINSGKSPVVEKHLDRLVAASVKQGTLSATSNVTEAARKSTLSMICVGTPSQPSGELDLQYVVRVCEEIGEALRTKSEHHMIVVRSTMLPGSVRSSVIPALERGSGKKCGVGFDVAINPEFLRESTAVYDFYNPPKTVIGADSKRAAEAVADLYRTLDAPLILTAIETAEMVKYTDNVFHALKIVFANEIGRICKTLEIDSSHVMDIFCQDRKLNISEAYFKPGFAYGGSCLPKDLRALTRYAIARQVDVPVLHAITASNEDHLKSALRLVLDRGRKRVGFLGFAFKGGTDDLRESAVVSLIEALLGKGYDVRVYDHHVSVARLMGANRKYIDSHIPHIERLMVSSVEELAAHAEIVIVGNESEEFAKTVEGLSGTQYVLDLTPGGKYRRRSNYERVCG